MSGARSRVLGMNLLAMTKHMAIRWEELGFLLGAVGGFLIAFGNMMPLGKRTGGMLGGIALAAGFVLAIIGVHYGRLG
jgi:hypothetical protein